MRTRRSPIRSPRYMYRCSVALCNQCGAASHRPLNGLYIADVSHPPACPAEAAKVCAQVCRYFKADVNIWPADAHRRTLAVRQIAARRNVTGVSGDREQVRLVSFILASRHMPRQLPNINPAPVGSTILQRPPGRLSQSTIAMHQLRHPSRQWPASLGGSRALRPPFPNRNPAPATTTLQQAIRGHKAAARRPSTSNPTRGAARSQTSASLHSASNDSHRSINNAIMHE
jgi:hypothetical protein